MTDRLLTGDIILSHPEWLWLLLALVIATLLLRVLSDRRDSDSVMTIQSYFGVRLRHPLIFLLPKQVGNQTRSWLNTLIFGFVFLGLVLSLCEPIRLGEALPEPPPERDIIFIVDTSVSMGLRDYVLDGARIDRMSMLKAVLDQFIQRLSDDRLAIIIFGDEAYTLVPLTRDTSLLRRMASRIQITMAGRFNNVGAAINLAVRHSHGRPSYQSQLLDSEKNPRHRVLVLLTDADTSTGEISTDAAVEVALSEKIPLYSVAIGASISAAKEQGITGLIYEPVDITLLKSISERTGGKFYQAGDVRALEQAIFDIGQNETNQTELEKRYYREPLYLWPLFFSLSLIVLLSLWNLMESRRQSSRLTAMPSHEAGDT